jgi:transcriptional regulator with XRE-family HTH domain
MPLNPTQITTLRERANLTQAEAARRAGLTRQGWGNLEHGRLPDPRASTLQRVAAALGCRVEELLE